MAEVLKRCKRCGKSFTVDSPQYAKQFCSDACREESDKDRKRAYYRAAHKPKKPHEIVCRKCGKTFLGRFQQRYCDFCLTDGSAYMTKLYLNRR